MMHTPDPISKLTTIEISKRLKDKRSSGLVERFPLEMLGGEPKPAAVLIPFLKQDDTWHVLFTRRTDTLPEHSGQVAFPGGRADPGDSTPEVTALREAKEEIGLNPTDVRLLGRLDLSRYHLELPPHAGCRCDPLAVCDTPCPAGSQQSFHHPARLVGRCRQITRLKSESCPLLSAQSRWSIFRASMMSCSGELSVQITLNPLNALRLS